MPRRAFTLIELLIVIVVLGILAAVVIFALGGISAKPATTAQSADRYAARNIATIVYGIDRAYTPPVPTTVAQFAAAAEAAHATRLLSVSSASSGAKFHFSDGTTICVSTGTSAPLARIC